MFITKYNKIILFSLFIVLSFLMVAQAVAAIKVVDTTTGMQKATDGLETTATKGYGKLPEANLSTIIGKIVGAALSFLGVVFFILIIYGGYMWMFSMGNEQTAAKAKDIIIAAVIGLVIVLMAYAITTFLSGAIGA